MTPSGTIGTVDAGVRADLTVNLGPKAPKGCHQVTDLVPSGLVPVGNLQGLGRPEHRRRRAKGHHLPIRPGRPAGQLLRREDPEVERRPSALLRPRGDRRHLRVGADHRRVAGRPPDAPRQRRARHDPLTPPRRVGRLDRGGQPWLAALRRAPRRRPPRPSRSPSPGMSGRAPCPDTARAGPWSGPHQTSRPPDVIDEDIRPFDLPARPPQGHRTGGDGVDRPAAPIDLGRPARRSVSAGMGRSTS